MKVAGSIVFVAALLAFSIWTWTAAPCAVWSLSKSGDMPARCLAEEFRK